jgi:hypothetical protein
MNNLFTFQFKNFKVEAFDGDGVIPFSVFLDDELVCESNFTPSPIHEPLSNVATLLDFLTFDEEAAAPEYFTSRNAPKLDNWANTNADSDVVRFAAWDFLDGQDDQGYFEAAEKFLNEHTMFH